jgi:hypothetical protein
VVGHPVHRPDSGRAVASEPPIEKQEDIGPYLDVLAKKAYEVAAARFTVEHPAHLTITGL